jgi:DNA-binding MarR family transcriptional regulator
MPRRASSSSPFTIEPPVGPPLIGALLRMPWEVVRRRMLEHLHARGFDDLDAAHLNVLQYPGPEGVRPSELAARLRITKQALNYLLRELERLGYLERHVDPDDLRSRRIVLTGRGRKALEEIRVAVAAVEREWEEQLGPERFRRLKELLLELGPGSV